jgi:phosphoglycerate dehydrogenase-like enzyme
VKEVLIDQRLDESALRCLESLAGIRVTLVPPHERRELPADLLHGKHVLVCKVPPHNFGDLTHLELLQLSTVGYEHLRDLGLADRLVQVCNARGVFDTAIAEWNVAMMVNLRRDLRGMIRNQDRSVWDRDARFQQEVRGLVVGLWGYGGIGRETARLARAMGMIIHVMTRAGVRPRPDAFAEPGTGDPEGRLPDRVFVAGQEADFLSGLDFLILALPHTQRSTGMIGERELRALPRSACLLNPARGRIVQDEALVRALGEGWIAGAALDTHFAYPLPADHPLWAMPNVILTPHIAGADRSDNFPARMGELVVQNVRRYLSGQPLLNVVAARELREA